ncbi:hypothetical protein SNEBB_005046 [Seison nebaliae]|nr:hypothetical protein SNEBB_005046 [Seison nebaliae]
MPKRHAVDSYYNIKDPSMDDDGDFLEETENSDDEYDESYNAKGKASGTLAFFDDEAVSDDEPQEIDDEETDELPKQNYTLKPREHDAQQIIPQDLHGDEINEYFADRYNAQTPMGTDVFREVNDSSIDPVSYLPNETMKEKIWIVQCRIGRENETVLRLMQKFMTLSKTTGEKLLIKSVIAKPNVKGRIYIEAFKLPHVNQAIENVNSLSAAKYKQPSMVTAKEMIDIMKIVDVVGEIRKNAWVRLKSSMYKDDLAKVMSYDQTENVVILKLIPRFEYTKKKTNKLDGIPNRKRRVARPSAKKFDMNIARQNGMTVKETNNGYSCNGMNFDMKGFLHRRFRAHIIVTQGVTPTPKELENFGESLSQALDDEQAVENLRKNSEKTNFAIGDVVIVLTSSLKNLTGRVLSINKDSVQIKPIHNDLTEPIDFPPHELRKFINRGDHVKVTNGKYKGDTGLVSVVDGNEVVLYSDISKDEIIVLLRDVERCDEKASGVDSSGQFSYGDIVEIDKENCGIIIRLENDHFTILNQYGHVRRVQKISVKKKKINKYITATDCKKMSISIGDRVKVVEGKFREQIATVKCIVSKYVFLSTKTIAINGGMFVCRANMLELMGATVGMNNNNNSNFSYKYSSSNDNSNFNSTTNFGMASPSLMQSPQIHEDNSDGWSLSGSSSPAIGQQSPNPHNNNSNNNNNSFNNNNNNNNRSNYQRRNNNNNNNNNNQQGRKNRFNPRNNPLLGRTAKIIRGTYKSYTGILKDITETLVKLELHSTCSTISIEVEKVKVEHENGTFVSLADYTAQNSHDSSQPITKKSIVINDTMSNSSATSPAPTSIPDSDDISWNEHCRTPAVPMICKTPNYPTTEDDYYEESTDYAQDNSPSNPRSILSTDDMSSHDITQQPSVCPSNSAYTPQTPIFATNSTRNDWVSRGLVVDIGENDVVDAELRFKTGVVTGIHGPTCSLELFALNRVVTVPIGALIPHPPEVNDRVKIIDSTSRYHDDIGQLQTLQTRNGLVSIRGDSTFVQLRHLCKVMDI